jgi:hypothetical protein
MFVCMELIHLPLGLEEVVGYVWTHNISTFPTFRPIVWERVPIRAQEMAAGATLSRYCVITVMQRVLV